MNNEDLIKKRFEELSNRAYNRGYSTYTEFLNLDEISVLKSMRLKIGVHLNGGYENAERCVAGFSDENIWDFPIVCIKIEPLQMKFADKLTHRDYLGALMNLGINRNTLGDIVTQNNVAYLFCLKSISQYIIDSLTRIRHTSVKCSIIDDIPTFLNKYPDEEEIIVSSLRADAIISSVYKLSRNATSLLFKQEKIFVNSRVAEKESFTIKDGDVISVRGYGKFIFENEVRRTKKDRIVISIRVYR